MARDDAAWLADLSLHNSQQNNGDGIAAAIMRLSVQPELLHRFLNDGSRAAEPPDAPAIRAVILLEMARAASPVANSGHDIARSLAYHHPAADEDRATSLEPRVFRPTEEDASSAIGIGDSPARPVAQRLPSCAKLVATALILMLMGLLALA